MELAHLDHNNECTEFASDMQSITPSSPNISDIVGAPQLSPRLGDEYQVEIPPRLTKLEDGKSEKVWPKLNITSEAELAKEFMPTTSWSEADRKSFLLGLFIFGKNFIKIKRFLKNRGMGEILSFYYGKFYKSDEHRRWSDCKKIKGRKCMTKQKLFTGWRKHELLSRLNSKVSGKLQDSMLQVSKSYAEGKTSLEEYIFSLESTVGLARLVEAVGIGREKEDLTSLTLEPGKKNQSLSIYSSMPTGKAWSSLEPNDIIKYLTGGFRLSKAKSNDLFWEAVWPRLLARGWHSEQPNNNPCFVSSRDYLVFLIPGVKKFSRRKLVKGDHYFDSVSDVLSKVVSEPNLLELEVEEAKVGGCTEEEKWILKKASDEDDQSNVHRSCYLNPRVSTLKTDDMEFTVVDTSFVYRGKSSDLRELKSLPLGFDITSDKINQSRGQERCSFGNIVGKFEVNTLSKTHKGDKQLSVANHKKVISGSINQKFTITDTSLVHRGKSSKVREMRYAPVQLKDTSKKMTAFSRKNDRISSKYPPGEKKAIMKFENKENGNNVGCHMGIFNIDVINHKGTDGDIDNKANKMVQRHQNQKICISDEKKNIKLYFNRRARSGQSNNAAPPIKRRRLTKCAKAETSHILELSSSELGSKKLTLCQSSSFLEVNKETGNQVNRDLNAEDGNKGSIHNKSCSKVEERESKPPILKVLEVLPKPENDEMMVEDDKCKEPNTEEVVLEPVGTSSGSDSMEQNPYMNTRRRSMRNRPLTIRAMESIENELLYL